MTSPGGEEKGCLLPLQRQRLDDGHEAQREKESYSCDLLGVPHRDHGGKGRRPPWESDPNVDAVGGAMPRQTGPRVRGGDVAAGPVLQISPCAAPKALPENGRQRHRGLADGETVLPWSYFAWERFTNSPTRSAGASIDFSKPWINYASGPQQDP